MTPDLKTTGSKPCPACGGRGEQCGPGGEMECRECDGLGTLPVIAPRPLVPGKSVRAPIQQTTPAAPALLDPALIEVMARALMKRCHPNRTWEKTHADYQAMWSIDAHAALMALCTARPDVIPLLRRDCVNV